MRRIKTQQDLDGIDPNEPIVIMSSMMIDDHIGEVRVLNSGSDVVVVRNCANVIALFVSRINSFDSTVTARGNSIVYGFGKDSITVLDESRADVSRGRVFASDNAYVRADTSEIYAAGFSFIDVGGNCEVKATDFSTLRLGYKSYSRSSKIEATGSVRVFNHGLDLEAQAASVNAANLFDSTSIADVQKWCEHYGVEVKQNIAYLYKAVDDNYTTDRGFDYSPGAMTSCDDFVADNQCGNGLHFSPTAHQARCFNTKATKFMRVGVLLSELVPIVDSFHAKAKAPRVVVACEEVSLFDF